MAMQLKNLSALSSTLSVTLLEASIVPLRRVGIMTSEVGVFMILLDQKTTPVNYLIRSLLIFEKERFCYWGCRLECDCTSQLSFK